MLAQFALKHECAGQQIRAALESGDRNQAERLAHSLKGVAGNLGVNQIFQLAGKLEHAIRESVDGVEGMADDLESALKRQVQSIQDGLKVTTPVAEKPISGPLPDPSVVSAAVARLRELLEASNAGSLKAYANLAETLPGTVDPSRLQELCSAIQTFNFETALLILNEIADQYGANKN